MEAAATAVRIRSAAAASTSYLCGNVPLRRHARRQSVSCRDAVRWRGSDVCLQIRGNAVAPEVTTRVANGAARKLQGATKMATLSAVPVHSKHAWIGALAAAVLAVEKQRRIQQQEHDAHPEALVDTLRRGKLVENDLVYRQTFVIRSYEAGFDKIASIETVANLFQETALNHVGLSKFVGDGMGTTHAMMRHRLIWVVTRMHVEVDRYPVWYACATEPPLLLSSLHGFEARSDLKWTCQWTKRFVQCLVHLHLGDVVEIDSWVAAEGKNGMRRDFIVRDYTSGEVIAKATSTWVMMNQDTRRLSKMPKEALAEISPFFLDKKCMKTEDCQKIKKLDDNAPYSRSDLVPRLRDMDMNQHVNNVKYISWVLESVPQSLLVAHELASMTLEYRRECTPSDVVQSLSCPDVRLASGPFRDASPLRHGGLDGSPDAVSCSSGALKSATISPTTTDPVSYTHLLRMQSSGADIVQGKTKWRVKERYVAAH